MIGVFGGSFDPIHNGHLAIAREAMSAAGLSCVLFMPVNIQPFKQDQQMTEGSHRREMLKLAVADEAAFGLTDVELRKNGVSYTIDSLRELREELPDGSSIYFLLGADMFFMLEKWHRSQELLREFAFMIGYREGKGTRKADILAEANRLRSVYGTEIICMENSPISISSSEIRERVKNGADISDLVPLTVRDYILEHSLYRQDVGNGLSGE